MSETLIICSRFTDLSRLHKRGVNYTHYDGFASASHIPIFVPHIPMPTHYTQEKLPSHKSRTMSTYICSHRYGSSPKNLCIFYTYLYECEALIPLIWWNFRFVASACCPSSSYGHCTEITNCLICDTHSFVVPIFGEPGRS